LALLAAVCVSGAAQDTPRAEVFLGYTYTRVNSATNVPAFSANGGGGQFVYNIGRWIGAVADIGAVHNGNIGGYHLDTTLTNFLFGPRIPIRVSNRVTPYFQTLFGGVYGSTSYAMNIPPGTVVSPAPVSSTTQNAANAVAVRSAAQQTAFAMAAGGGLDIKINNWLSFRPIGLDYFMTRLQNLRSVEDNNQHHIRYTTGFNFKLGGEKPLPAPPPPPATKGCWNGTSVPLDQDCPKRVMNPRMAGAQPELCPGASLSVTAADVPDSASLEWTVNGQPISQGRTFEFGATGREPGTYTIGLSASAAEYNNGSTTSTVTVLPYRAPAGTLQVSPAEIWAGEEAALSARFNPGQCGGSLRGPEYSAAEGSVRGDRFDSSGIRFDPSDNSEQRKTVKLQARVTDQRGVTAAEATVVVKKRAALVAKRLPDIVFPANSARVNNCGKRVLLEELKALTQADPGGKVVFVGHTASKEKKAGLDEQRAMNAAAVISAGSGICSSFPAPQIMVSSVGIEDNGVDLQPNFCGTSATPKTAELSGQAVKESDDQAKYRRVEVWFIPANGILPTSVKGAKEASTLPVKSLGCPK
jgi:outer membrane protein OmpA-like peptidoglycan-associated protein